jgi:hypothetical protein
LAVKQFQLIRRGFEPFARKTRSVGLTLVGGNKRLLLAVPLIDVRPNISAAIFLNTALENFSISLHRIAKSEGEEE